MSAAVMCDFCGTVLGPLRPNGDDDNGERAGWIVIEAGGRSWDLCTRSCATQLLNDSDSPLVEQLDLYQEAIAEIVQTIKDDLE